SRRGELHGGAFSQFPRRRGARFAGQAHEDDRRRPRIERRRLRSARMEIGIIGAGWWAAQAYIPLLLSDRRITACAVCRPDPEGLESIRREFGIRHLFTDAREMLLRRPLAGVIVASPHHLHAEHAAMCLA